MLNEMLKVLKGLNLNAQILFDGVIVSLENATITVGYDESGFSTYVEEQTPNGPVFASQERITKDAVLELCQKYVPTAA